MELTDLGVRIADGETVDWAASTLITPSPSTVAVLEQLKVLERIATVHASSLPPATIGKLPSLDLHQTTGVADSAAPARWGRLDVIRRVGRGTFGDVYLAHDRSLDRPVALKLLRHREGVRDPAAPDVIEEGRLLARVRHPNIVAVYGAERIDQRVGVWTEFVDGVTLADELQSRGPFSPAEVASIGADLCGALQVVHDAGLLHRDIKAQNVMRDASGRVLLTDFGAGRLITDDQSAVRELVGTPIYLAPEILAGDPATRASDIYSVGVLLHFLASATYPVSGRSLRDLRDAHQLAHRTPLGRVSPELPVALVTAIDRATDPEPTRRFSSASAFADALRPGLVAPQPSLPRRLSPIFVALVIASIAGVGGLAIWTRSGHSVAEPDLTAAPGITTHQFWPAWQATATPAALAPDGRWILCTIRNEPPGQLARCPIDGSAAIPIGQVRALPYPVLSPDGRRVAYIRRPSGPPPLEQGTHEVHIVSIDATTDDVVLTRSASEGQFSLDGWSADSRTIAIRFNHSVPGRPSPLPDEVTLISATTFKPIVTASLPDGATFPKLSPDGRTMVFGRGSPGSRGDIWTMNIATAELTHVVTGASRDLRPFWSTSGSSVLFTSDRAGTFGLWRAPLKDGKPAGPPEQISELGRAIAWPYGFSRNGQLLVGLEPFGSYDSYMAEIDVASASMISPPARIARDLLDANATPDWSREGRMALLSEGSDQGPGFSSTAMVLDASGQIDSQFPVIPRFYQTRLRWLPDGRSVAIGLEAPWRSFDTATGREIGMLLPGVRTNGVEIDVVAGHIVYRRVGDDRRQEIVVRELVSGRERVLLQASALNNQRVPSFSVDPSGRQVAVSRRHPDDTYSLDVAENEGSSLRTILTWPHQIVQGPWTRDGRHLLFSRLLDRASSRSEVVVLDVTTGTARPLPIVMRQIWQMRLHPDGRRLAFVTGASGQEMALLSGAALR